MRRPQNEPMTYVSLKLTLNELELLTSLASDQLFRREFIDPKMPGHRADSARLALGKSLLSRLQLIAAGSSGRRHPVNHSHAL